MNPIDKRTAVEMLPEILDRLDDHCQWCADCDWDNDPDLSCRFGAMWKNLRGDKIEHQIAPFNDGKMEGCFSLDRCEVVVSVEHLKQLADERRSVYVSPIGKMPAAVVINWQAAVLLRQIEAGNITIVPKKARKAEQLLPKFRLALYNHCLMCGRRSAVGCKFPAIPDKTCAFGKLILEDRKLMEVRKDG